MFHPAMLEPTYFDLLRFNHMVPDRHRVPPQRLRGPRPVRRALRGRRRLGLQPEPRAGRRVRLPRRRANWRSGISGQTRGDAGNTVIDKRHLHIRDDRRVRDRAVREYVDEYGPGAAVPSRSSSTSAPVTCTGLDRIGPSRRRSCVCCASGPQRRYLGPHQTARVLPAP